MSRNPGAWKRQLPYNWLEWMDKMPNPDTILHSQGQDVSMYRELTFHPQVNACILSRETSVLSYRWQVISTGSDTSNRATDFVYDMFAQFDMVYLFRSIMEAIWFGYAVIDLPLNVQDGYTMYAQPQALPIEWFSFSPDSDLLFLAKQNVAGEKVHTHGPDKEVELVQYRYSYRNPYGEAELARTFWPVHLMQGDLRLWISFLDRYGDDSLFIRTENPDTTHTQGLMDMLQAFRSSGGGVIESSDEILNVNVDKSASVELFESFYQLLEASISKTLLGHSAALDSTPGRLGQDIQASVVRWDIALSDIHLIEGVVNRMLRWILDKNFLLSQQEYPLFQFCSMDEEERRMKRDVKVSEMGYQLSEEYMQRIYRFEPGDISLKTEQDHTPKQQMNQDIKAEKPNALPPQKNNKKDPKTNKP